MRESNTRLRTASTGPGAAWTIFSQPSSVKAASFGSGRCDCGPQLREAVEEISAVGGFLLYLRQEGRGIGLYAKLGAYALQDQSLDTYEANVALGRGEDERDYSAAARMLGALGAGRISLLTNNSDKAGQLVAHGIGVRERVPTGVQVSEANHRYLARNGTTPRTPSSFPT